MRRLQYKLLSILVLPLALPQSAAPPPLTRTDVLGLLASSATPVYAAHLIQQRGISFQVTDEYMQMLAPVAKQIEQVLKAPSTSRSAEPLSAKEAAVLPHVARCRQLRPALAEAERECRAALDLSPRNAFLLMALGSRLASHGKRDAAAAVLRQAIAVDPQISEIHLQLADFLANEDRGAALRQALEALRLDPNNSDVFGYFAFVFGDSGVRDVEFSILQDEIVKHPKDAAAHWILGWAYVEGKMDKENALKHLREAVRLDPNNAYYHYFLSGELSDSGDAAGAAAELQMAQKLDPTNPMFRAH